MRHLYNYIIKISKDFNDTFKTESGFELFGHKDFNKDRLSNRYATIVNSPFIFDGNIIDNGSEVLIDPSVYYHSTHGEEDVKQYTTNTIDQKEGFYAIEPQNIVAYKKDGKWIGYLGNFMALRIIDEKEDKKEGGIIVEFAKKHKTDKYIVTHKNEFLKDNDVEIGDTLFIRPRYGVSVWLDGKEHTWLRDVDVLAKMN